MTSTTNPDTLSALAEPPSADTITLLLKCHKSTTLLSVLPTTPFPEIKIMLLAALRLRNLTTLPNSPSQLPDDAEDLEFGVLADKKDASRGWVPLEIKEQEVPSSKSSKKRVGSKNSVFNESPLGAGLADGSWIAYRLKAPTKGEPAEMGDAEDGTPEVDIDDDPGWDVVIPSFDDEME